MSEKSSNGSEPPRKIDDHRAAELQRLVAEAQARGEDPFPIVQRSVLDTIDELAKRVPRTPDGDC